MYRKTTKEGRDRGGGAIQNENYKKFCTSFLLYVVFPLESLNIMPTCTPVSQWKTSTLKHTPVSKNNYEIVLLVRFIFHGAINKFKPFRLGMII